MCYFILDHLSVGPSWWCCDPRVSSTATIRPDVVISRVMSCIVAILVPLWSFLKTTCRTSCMLSLHCCQYFEENRNMNQLCKTWIYFLWLKSEAKVEVPAFLSLASRGRIPGIKITQRSRDVSLCTEGGVGGNEALGVIKSQSEWSSPILLILRDDGCTRFLLTVANETLADVRACLTHRAAAQDRRPKVKWKSMWCLIEPRENRE